MPIVPLAQAATGSLAPDRLAGELSQLDPVVDDDQGVGVLVMVLVETAVPRVGVVAEFAEDRPFWRRARCNATATWPDNRRRLRPI